MSNFEVATGLSHDELVSKIDGFDALIVRSGTTATGAIIDAGSSLKVIGRAGVGIDNVDVDAATRNGVVVSNTPGANTNAAVEQTIGLMLGAARSTAQAHASLLDGQWARSQFVGTELKGKTLGIIGFGRIGRRVAAISQAIGMTVVAHDPYVEVADAAEVDVELTSIENVLASADVLTLHMAPPADGKPFLDAVTISKLKPGAIIVNAARGSLIDAEALSVALTDGRIRAAGIDVYASEPPASDHPLIGHPRVVHTPHLGASTVEAQQVVAVQVVEQVLTTLRGEGFPNSVNIHE